MTGGLSTTIKSNTSEPTESNDNSRELPSRSAALGGSGPEAMNARLGISVFCSSSGGSAGASQIVAKPIGIVEIHFGMQRRLAHDRRRSARPSCRSWQNAAPSSERSSTFPRPDRRWTPTASSAGRSRSTAAAPCTASDRLPTYATADPANSASVVLPEAIFGMMPSVTSPESRSTSSGERRVSSRCSRKKASANAAANPNRTYMISARDMFGDDGEPGNVALSTMKTLLAPTPPAMSTSL